MLRRLCLPALCLVACGASSQPATPSPAPDASPVATSATSAASGTPATTAAEKQSEPSPPPPTTAAPASSEDIDLEAALAAAKKQNKPAFVVFCAKWVAACGELAHVLVDPGVKKTLEDRFVVVRVDVSNDDDPKTRERMKKLNVKGLPFMAVFDRKGKEVERESTFLDAARLAKLLEKAK